jgi:hypothetical protein
MTVTRSAEGVAVAGPRVLLRSGSGIACPDGRLVRGQIPMAEAATSTDIAGGERATQHQRA